MSPSKVVERLQAIAAQRSFGQRGFALDLRVGTSPAVRICSRDEGTEAGATLTVCATEAHSLFLGDSHEIALMLVGELKATGGFREILRALATMEVVKDEYRRRCESTPAILHRNLDSDTIARAEEFPIVSLPATLDADLEHQALLAAVIFLALPSACRSFELHALLRSHAEGRISDAALTSFISWLGEFGRVSAWPNLGMCG